MNGTTRLPTLLQVEDAVRRELAACVRDKSHPWRVCVLATTDGGKRWTKKLDGRRIAEAGFAARRLMLFGVLAPAGAAQRPALTRYPLDDGRDFYFNPPAAFELRAEDQLVVLGRELSIAHFRQQVASSALGRRPS